MFFQNLDFFIKKHDFSRIVLSLKQNHYFWRVGVDFEGPQNRPKSKKVSSGPFKNHSFETTKKHIIFIKICEQLNPQKWCSRLRKTTISEKYASWKVRKYYRFLRSKIRHFSGFGLILGGQKSCKIMTCWEHEKHKKSMVYAALMRL